MRFPERLEWTPFPFMPSSRAHSERRTYFIHRVLRSYHLTAADPSAPNIIALGTHVCEHDAKLAAEADRRAVAKAGLLAPPPPPARLTPAARGAVRGAG